ncbi:MAG: aromatic-ring-hydroxylating dioxygenase subunit beta [Gammaproteobacteria bacterium]|nr:MAG: aromatic-ring-hydroxylating dioxygenase subunit beta [Gammaproteobacteria bacterium]RLA13403.1 MAG: aromatic-ring-hydroxylating dioxygenase subunit beta [Gammaproteobacteria bacterium]RLA17540.1 MAG: aromatic-ring-hydroxylating dioxygenase subunit beta [Gammaproteobacteria bacterium]
MSQLSNEILLALDNAQNSYIHALDTKNMDGWLASFTTDGSYICIAAENEANNLPIALMLDDCYARLQDRVTYVTKVWAGTFEDYQTRHFTQRISAEAMGNDTYKIITNYHILFTPEQGQTNVLVTGHYDDEIVLGDTPLFKSKKAVMDTNVSPRYIVYPV